MFLPSEFIKYIKKKNYNIEIHEHAPLFTVDDSKSLRGKIEGTHSKNLFLKNKKNQFFLLSCEESDKINLKEICKSLGFGNISFAREEYLKEYLGINPGSVSPFALLNDKHNKVNFYLENKLYESNYINFHPMVNTLTIKIETKKFMEFMIENNKKIHIFSSAQGKILETYG